MKNGFSRVFHIVSNTKALYRYELPSCPNKSSNSKICTLMEKYAQHWNNLCNYFLIFKFQQRTLQKIINTQFDRVQESDTVQPPQHGSTKQLRKPPSKHRRPHHIIVNNNPSSSNLANPLKLVSSAANSRFLSRESSSRTQLPNYQVAVQKQATALMTKKPLACPAYRFQHYYRAIPCVCVEIGQTNSARDPREEGKGANWREARA